MRGRASEVVETVSRRRIAICAVQESRWRDNSARLITGKDSNYKFWSGDESGQGGVGLLLEESLVENVLSVERVDNRIMFIRVMIGKTIFRVFSAYAPKTGLPEQEKDSFYNNLLSQTSVTPEDEFMLVCGDLNGHVGEKSRGFVGAHGGNGYGVGNADGTRILDFCTAANLSLANTYFVKEENKLSTYRSGQNQSQIDFIIVRRSQLKHVQDTKVINGEECTPQHKLLVADINVNRYKVTPTLLPARRRVWKLKEPAIRDEYQSKVHEAIANSSTTEDVETTWNDLKSCVFESFDATCGWTKAQQNRKETWWWCEKVESEIKEKRKLWKNWKNGGPKEPYLAAKGKAKHEVYLAKKAASEASFNNLREKDKLNHVFKMKSENQDIVGEKCVRNDQGNIVYDDDAKLLAWKEHYHRLLNVEFIWDESTLTDTDPVI